MQRYFAKAKDNNRFILEDSDYHHIKNVMRMQENDIIEVIDEQSLYLAHIEKIEQDIQIVLDKFLDCKSLATKITLIIPVLKEQKMDFILQKATELGVYEIIPVMMEHCLVNLKEKEEKKLLRWRKIVKEASEQSKRYQIPFIQAITTFKDLPSLNGVKLVCSTRENNENIKKLMKTIDKCDRINVVIGPEGGLSTKEEENLINKGYIPVSLGDRILRVETVPIYLLSILNYENLL